MSKDFKVIDEHYEAGTKAFRSYVTGFILSIFLTIVPYLLVVNHALTARNLVFAIVFLGIIQLVVQVIFFLHLNARSNPRWNIAVFIFTTLTVIILVVGSLWIMNNLEYNMMDTSPSQTNEGQIPHPTSN